MTKFFLDILPLVATVFLTICYIPQVVKNYKTKSVEDMSLWFWVLLNVALMFMWSNALVIFINFHTFGYLVTESINEGLALVVLIQILIYRKK